ncbi:uncharacterized protein LOC131316443 isoform X2 [Rhododendron vialii]|uniref:uncharacterized protein LOC131316443 isoform X2 n=1 Tax=Rhododendron vialii TaxID=182163 RepID=UPI00265FCAB1|nr:uncharacterized protein LOC131316443 isoform X2 [Rhododendron vialii]
MMAIPPVFLSAVLSYLVVISESTPTITPIATETSLGNQRNHRLTLELEEAKLKIARLESIFDETVQHINAKSLSLEECEKLITDMTHEMDRLQSDLSSLKGESSRANERLNQLEEEVRLLWANMRKTNFELHHLESKAQDAENNMNLVASQVEKMAAIVTEQWIQIRQLEQALHNAEVQALTVKRSPTRCKFLKFLRNLFGNHLQKLKGILDLSLFHKESPLHQLEKISSAAKKYHHELQGFIKQEMEKNEFTAALANKEVVFFVVSYCSSLLGSCLIN